MLSLGLSGCVSQSPEATVLSEERITTATATRVTAPASSTTAPTRIIVGLALDVGGRTDGAAGSEAAHGLDRAVKDIGIGVVEVTAAAGDDEARRADRLRELVRAGCTHVIAVGSDYWGPAARIAAESPRVQLAVVDVTSGTTPLTALASAAEGSATAATPLAESSRLTRLTFADEQGAYLAGAAAALKTRTHRIGFLARERDGAT